MEKLDEKNRANSQAMILLIYFLYDYFETEQPETNKQPITAYNLPAPSCSDLLTSHGCSSLAWHNQDLCQHQLQAGSSSPGRP